MDAEGDYTFGRGTANFLVNTPAAVAQCVTTRLLLWRGSWFLDVTIGTPWLQQVLGTGTKAICDMAIRSVILKTQGVTSIANYSSSVDPTSRTLTVDATINTQYGQTPVQVVL